MSRYKNYTLLGVATITAILMRTFMSFFIIDANSGFIKSEYLPIAIFILVVILLAAVVLCYFGASSDIDKTKKPKFDGVFPCIISVLLGLSLIIGAFNNSILPAWQKGLEVILSIVFGFYLIFYAIAFMAKIKLPNILSIIAVVFWIVKLVNIFTTYSVLSNTVDNIFEIFTICGVLIFFLSFSKGISLKPDAKSLKTLNAASYLACFMAFSYSLPKAIVMLINNSLSFGEGTSLLTLFSVGIYILTFIIKNTSD